ncbi:MAG: hypothetical protein K6E59_00920 [Bacilli bacterium]|nr:hypothetical protein [Bacilli bacterium]
MICLLLAGMAMALVTVGFQYSYSLSGVHAVYLGLYKGLVEEAVVVAGTDGEYASPRFYLPRLNQLCKDYLDTGLTPYCRSYEMSVLGYSKGRYVPSVAYSTRVQISFTATFSLERSLTKTAYFRMERSEA